ncbi:MAG: hypothetical protein K5866_02140 [Treponema sp.]|nr:hypothetical protein [Treponema sp.]
MTEIESYKDIIIKKNGPEKSQGQYPNCPLKSNTAGCFNNRGYLIRNIRVS